MLRNIAKLIVLYTVPNSYCKISISLCQQIKFVLFFTIAKIKRWIHLRIIWLTNHKRTIKITEYFSSRQIHFRFILIYKWYMNITSVYYFWHTYVIQYDEYGVNVHFQSRFKLLCMTRWCSSAFVLNTNVRLIFGVTYSYSRVCCSNK